MHNTKQIEEWIDLYGQKLFDRAFYLLSNREDAEDIVQDVYVAAYSAIDKFQGKSSSAVKFSRFKRLFRCFNALLYLESAS